MTKHQFLILCALLRFPMHPYAVRQEVIELSYRRVWPSHSTIRCALDALLQQKLIQSCDSDPHYWLKARRGEPYEITEKGKKALALEWEMYRQLTSVVKVQLDVLGIEARRL